MSDDERCNAPAVTIRRRASRARLGSVVGRRGGKSLILALIAVFLACFIDWLPYLAPGERGTVMVIAADRRQARVIYRYAVALLREVPMLKALMVARPRKRSTSRTASRSRSSPRVSARCEVTR